MKKRSFLLTVFLILCLLLAGCGGKDTPEKPTPDPVGPSEDPGQDPKTPDAQLQDVTLESWELYNPNGFDTLTAVISNPNAEAIDVTYDVVYFKDGAEVARNKDYTGFSLLPNSRNIVWANWDVPASGEADEVKLDNIKVSKAYYKPINGKYEYAETTGGEVFFDFTFDSKPELAEITFLLYNDDNENGCYDQGEIVVTSTASLMEQSGRVSFTAEGYAYTDYEVFFIAN